MEITAKLVKDLRDQTGAGMMKCKEALAACNGNLEEAVDYLRKKGLASADKKSGRATSQGLILPLSSADHKVTILCEVNCETDFVARNDKFQTFINAVGQIVLNNPCVKTVADLDAAKLPDGQTVEEARKTLIATIGENISLGRFERFEIAGHGVFDTYLHNEGTLGVLVQLECSSAALGASEDAKNVAHDIALQAAAMKARFVSRHDVPAATIKREQEVIKGQIQNDEKNKGKPESILAKIIDGRLDKFFKEFCLVEQTFIKDDSKTINDLLTEVGKKHGGTVTVKLFRRWAIGEAPEESAAAPATQEAACCASCCAS